MASLGLGFVGTAIGGALFGPLGAAIGGALGATAGQFTDNLLFGKTARGPQLTDLSVTSSAYGATIPLVYGPENRIAGNVIWSDGLTEHKKKHGSGLLGSKTKTYSYTTSVAVALCEGPVSSLGRIWFNKKLVFDPAAATVPLAPPTASVGMYAPFANGTHDEFDHLRFYQGNGTQIVDPTIEAVLGVGNVPAYRHTCYVVLDFIYLKDFGNALPNMEFELIADGAITIAEVALDLCARAGVTEVSAASLTDQLKGFVVANSSTAEAALQPLALAYGFDVAEQRGAIRFAKRGGPVMATIPVEDLGAAAAGNAAASPYNLARRPDVALPKAAAVTFKDPALDYQPNTQQEERAFGSADANLSNDLPLVLNTTKGREVATRLLYEAWAARLNFSGPVSDRWIGLDPAHLIAVPLPGGTMPFKVTRLARGANAVTELEGRFEDPEIYSSVLGGISGFLPDNPLVLSSPATLMLLDMPIVRDVDDNSGFYWGASTLGTWRGANVLRSTDGTIYEVMGAVPANALLGSVASALPSGPSDIWDRVNTLTVVMDYPGDELESVSEDELLPGVNLCWLGGTAGQNGELFQFATATLTAPKTYALTNLIRGLRGTEYAIAGHGANERFVLMELDFMERNDFGAADWNKLRHYKPVAVNQDEASATPQDFTNAGESKRPLSPVFGSGARDGSNNLTVSWTRRSRALGPGLGNGSVPLFEESESYELDVIVGGSVARTIAAVTPTASYSAANQTTDGITPGNPVTLNIYQLSAIRGRGRAGAFVV